MPELLTAYGGKSLAENVFRVSSITPDLLEDPYTKIDYMSAAAVFDSILLNVDSLEELCRTNRKLKLVNPWGLSEVFAAQARSRTLLEYWARLQSMTRLLVGGWKSALRDDGELVTITSDWSNHPGVGFSTLGACFSAYQLRDMLGVEPVSMCLPYLAGRSLRQRLAAEFPNVDIEFNPPIQKITYRRSEVIAAPPLPQISGPRMTYRELLETYYSPERRRAAVFVWETTNNMISEGLEPTLDLLAGKVNIQPRVLQRALATGGLTMRSIIERIRVSTAEDLLADTTDSILDVALATGYTSHQALSKVFKRWRGLTPKEYRFHVRRNRPELPEKPRPASHRDEVMATGC